MRGGWNRWRWRKERRLLHFLEVELWALPGWLDWRKKARIRSTIGSFSGKLPSSGFLLKPASILSRMSYEQVKADWIREKLERENSRPTHFICCWSQIQIESLNIESPTSHLSFSKQSSNVQGHDTKSSTTWSATSHKFKRCDLRSFITFQQFVCSFFSAALIRITIFSIMFQEAITITIIELLKLELNIRRG